MGAWLADWPRDDVVALWDDLAKRFAQLGGNSGPYFLRMVGKDTFILSPSVISALEPLGRLRGHAEVEGRSRAACRRCSTPGVRARSRPLCQVSMILALSSRLERFHVRWLHAPQQESSLAKVVEERAFADYDRL